VRDTPLTNGRRQPSVRPYGDAGRPRRDVTGAFPHLFFRCWSMGHPHPGRRDAALFLLGSFGPVALGEGATAFFICASLCLPLLSASSTLPPLASNVLPPPRRPLALSPCHPTASPRHRPPSGQSPPPDLLNCRQQQIHLTAAHPSRTLTPQRTQTTPSTRTPDGGRGKKHGLACTGRALARP
jgi:hypothetical protein